MVPAFRMRQKCKIGTNTEPYASRTEVVKANLPDATFWISGKYPYKGFGELQPSYAKAKISIWWKRDANNIPIPGLKKPVIIVDGFDPNGGRKDTSIYSLFEYKVDATSAPIDFARELRANGFDIVVMDMPGYTKDFPGTINDPTSTLTYPKALFDLVAPDNLKGVIFGGGDFQQRNAYVLEGLIDYCNQQMQNNGSNEQLVLVGPSMGGQITRYALRDMELRGQNHNCRLWVSFDSHHQGSYAPMGIQYSLEQLAKNSNEAAFFKSIFLDCPEAKQSLIHHYSTNSETVQAAAGYYSDYYNEVNNPAFGFPQAAGLRRIAMLSGSDLGVSQTFGTACQLATKVEAKYRPRKLLAIISFSPLAAILSPLQTQNTYLAPATGQCTVFKLSADIGQDILKKIYAPTWSSTSLDMLQGGHFPSFKIYKDAVNGKRPQKWYKNLVKLYADDYVGSQVQQLTYSTLAIGLGSLPDPTRKWDDNFRKDKFNQPIDVTCPETKESPFDMYWAPDINTRHDSLLLGHVVRLRKEVIDKQPWPRTPIERSATITGNKTLLCPGESVNVSISNLLPGINYQWVTSNPLLTITSGQGTPNATATLSASSTLNGGLSIACNASSNCYYINPQQYSLYTGKPSIVGTYTAPGNSSQYLTPSIPRQPCTYNDACESSTIITSMLMPQGLTISWTGGGTNPGDVVWWQTGNNLSFYFTGQDQTAIFNATSSNCGQFNNVRYCFRSVSSPACPPALRPVKSTAFIKVFPNPSSSTILVTLKDENRKTKIQGGIYEIRVIDKMGVIKYQQQYTKGSKSVIVDVNKLNMDVYNILVFDGKTWMFAKFLKN